jgi:hypothetical protein
MPVLNAVRLEQMSKNRNVNHALMDFLHTIPRLQCFRYYRLAMIKP